MIKFPIFFSFFILLFPVSKLVINNAVTQLSGYVNHCLRERQEKGDQSLNLPDAENEYILNPNDDLNKLIADYNELSIQFGFMTLFIAACPFIPAIALVTNMVEIKKDGREMLQLSRYQFFILAKIIRF